MLARSNWQRSCRVEEMVLTTDGTDEPRMDANERESHGVGDEMVPLVASRVRRGYIAFKAFKVGIEGI